MFTYIYVSFFYHYQSDKSTLRRIARDGFDDSKILEDAMKYMERHIPEVRYIFVDRHAEVKHSMLICFKY
jgi:hypothetical protein